MSNVLFDTPGPKALRRHRAIGVLAGLAILGALAWVLVKFNDTGQLEYAKWEPFLTPKYVSALLGGVRDTVSMALASVLLAVIFGFLFGVGKLSDHRLLRWPSWVIVEFFRAVPVLLLMIFIYYAWGIDHGSFGSYWSVAIALMAYNGAVLAEIVRAGINAVPAGQSEAAYALGLRKGAVTRIIQLPQAVKIMIPAIISQCVVALKDTSLGYAILAPGLSTVGKQIYINFNNQVPTVLVMAVLYILLNLILTAIATWAQRKFVGENKLDITVVATGLDGNAAVPGRPGPGA